MTTASTYFGSMIEGYDSLIRRCVPRYEEMTERLVEYLPAEAKHVLELGCGTGNLSLRLAARYPDAAITFVDASPEMVELTRARVAAAHPEAAERGRFVVSRFEELAVEPESFDLATSAISLHHVVEKSALFKVIRRMLAPGGTLRFADQMWGATEGNAALNWQRWLEFCRLPGNCTEEEIGSLVAHARAHDHYEPVAAHLRMLESAGFAGVDCVWRNWMWGIVTADAV
ncbi:class I SAM-dependent methyltransferase [Longimicrobium sp.]|uniref:class I SAM-dependent methyltransferase n=1 Tax=Longimicrobium sp. TaxID=2029185 RepID=UPI002CEAA507|nr:class I SAM-dependent methyltransferase [Longimicrobium sp.]HSU12694.1 class I SAM-dependent methyltransferase [Longimicrobium sp.]